MSAENTLTKTLKPGSHQADMEVKKSKFLGYAQHVETWEEAQEYVVQFQQQGVIDSEIKNGIIFFKSR